LDDARRKADFDDAFAELYLRARRITYAVVGDLPTAEDLAAAALGDALARWRRIRSLPHRDAWVLRRAARSAVDRVQRRRRPPPPAAVVDDPDLVVLAPEAVDALVHLPGRDREAVVLVLLGGCSETEVAALTGDPQVTIAQRVRRGLQEVRRQAHPPASEPGGTSHALG
jgi:DNA-directed RNA polymerase specialized sigma24 family protein